jgi:hypothetical protein
MHAEHRLFSLVARSVGAAQSSEDWTVENNEESKQKILDVLCKNLQLSLYSDYQATNESHSDAADVQIYVSRWQIFILLHGQRDEVVWS